MMREVIRCLSSISNFPSKFALSRWRFCHSRHSCAQCQSIRNEMSTKCAEHMVMAMAMGDLSKLWAVECEAQISYSWTVKDGWCTSKDFSCLKNFDDFLPASLCLYIKRRQTSMTGHSLLLRSGGQHHYCISVPNIHQQTTVSHNYRHSFQ